jgi:hypothetical protein
MSDFAMWLGRTSLSAGLAQAAWLIPLLQSLHIIALAMVLSAVAMIDLRLFGVTRSHSMAQTVDRFMPLLWLGLALLAFTGAILIASEPKRTLNGNTAFYLKMGLLAVALSVTIAFQLAVRTKVAWFEGEARHRMLLQAFAIATLVLWFAIAVAGRWIAYVQVR